MCQSPSVLRGPRSTILHLERTCSAGCGPAKAATMFNGAPAPALRTRAAAISLSLRHAAARGAAVCRRAGSLLLFG